MTDRIAETFKQNSESQQTSQQNSNYDTDNRNILDIFFENLAAERNSSLNTIGSYKNDLTGFCIFLKKSLLDVTEADILSYRKSLEDAGMKPSTVARKIVAIRQLFRFLFQEGRIRVNPTREIVMPRHIRPLPKIIGKEEIFTLLDNTMKDTSPEGRRKWLLFELLYGAGLRVSELVSLRISDFSLNPKTRQMEPFVWVRGKGGKERMVPIHETCLEALRCYLLVRPVFIQGKDSLWLFPSKSSSGHLTRRWVNELLKQSAFSAGVDGTHLSPHVIRHAFATHLLEGGANLMIIQRLLGHADIATTQIYTHVQSTHLYELVSKYHPLSPDFEEKNLNQTDQPTQPTGQTKGSISKE